MPEPLKNVYNNEFLRQFSEKLHCVYSAFDRKKFIAIMLDETWEELPLKRRMHRITEALGRCLPTRFEKALYILFAIDADCTGFPYLFFPDFVATYGLLEEHWELSIAALERFTIRSSSEFAVRPFLLRNPERMIQQMEKWAKHSNEHVRRLASEGCRPRLPWGQSLPMFKRDPAPVFRILEILKADPSLYVRKSVANNLNDIAKDHPALVIETARGWLGVNPYTDWIVRQGCRTLIRKAYPEVMELFGYAKNNDETSIITQTVFTVEPSEVAIGEVCELHYELLVRVGEPLHIRVEYAIDFVKAGGRLSRKNFLLTDKSVPGGVKISGSRSHSWRNLTTRTHYSGKHRIVLLVNGHETAATIVRLVGTKTKQK